MRALLVLSTTAVWYIAARLHTMIHVISVFEIPLVCSAVAWHGGCRYTVSYYE